MAKRFDPYEMFCNILANSDWADSDETPDCLSNLIQERTHKVSWVSLTDILEQVAYLHPKIHHPPKISSYENGTHLQVMSVSVSTRVCKQDQPSECGQQERMGHAWGCF